MSWCDKLASTPGVGFLLSPHFFSADTLVESLSPILDQWVDGLDRPTFTVNQHASFNVSLTTKDGFTYGFDHNRVHVAFNHRIRAKPVSGGPPVMEMLSVPKPYTALLDEACERLIEATSLLPHIQGRKIMGAGIITTTAAAAEDIPPGVAWFVDYMTKPWGRELESFNINVLSVLSDSDVLTDKCLHTAVKTDDSEKLLTIVFDFHRRLKVGNQVSHDNLSSLLHHCRDDALKYFEELAEGNRFDEHDNSDTEQLLSRV